VLPFAEPEGASTGGYLGDGIAETILEELGRFEGIQPVARSSSFAFRDAQRDAREIGQALGADMVLDGSVRRWENRGRFWVQLVDTDSGLQIWSHTYEREMGDVFEIQDDVGQAVAAALRARLRGGHAPAVPRPVSLDAWDRYIRGRHSWYERSIPSLETALDCFRGALELDPTYAEAWTGVADVYAQLGNHVYGLLPPDHAMPEARAAANKALVLRPDLSSAHTALAAVQFNYDWDLEEAERSYRRALELDPSNAVARLSYAFALASTERWEEAQVQLRRARELDPISAIGFTIRAHLRYFRRDFAGALDVVEDALKHDPTFRSAHLLRALIRVQLGEPGRALEELGAPPAGASGEPDTVGLGVSALLLGLSGDVAAASALGDQLAAMRAERFVPAECLALAALGSADWDGAVHWLGEAKSERSSSVLYVGLEPLVDPIRDHPGFPALLPDGPLSSTSDLSKGTDLKAD